uniref:Aquaporin n=1 Tax=Lotharella oceanica TaxID=641309 RepID=A0A7S2TQ54_9EUKA
MLFSLVVMSVRSNENRRSSLVIAFAYVALRLFAFSLTFSTLNPARSMGPVAASGFTDGTGHLWVEWTAPVVGSALGAIGFYFFNSDTLSTKQQRSAPIV